MMEHNIILQNKVIRIYVYTIPFTLLMLFTSETEGARHESNRYRQTLYHSETEYDPSKSEPAIRALS